MHISAFQISGFGIFSNVEQTGIEPGLGIFFGLNEAGKSTCLEFFRAMLTGYPEKTGRGQRDYSPINGGQAGGSLVLQWQGGELRVARAPGDQGGLRLRDAEGNSLPPEFLRNVMGGVDREIYSQYFAFSIDELERWDRSGGESARNVLYGASFGPGLAAPGQAIANIETEMGKIFKPRGSRQPLNRDMAELEEIRARIIQCRSENAMYDEIARKQAEKKLELGRITAEHGHLARDLANVERRLANRQQWERWRRLGARLAELPKPPENFPEDAQARLARIESDKNSCQRDLAGARERLRQMQAKAEDISIDNALLAETGALERMDERKAAYRHAMRQLANLEAASQRAQSGLASSLALLGPGWTCERIRQTDRSLFARENIDRLAASLADTREEHRQAVASLNAANAAFEQAEKAAAEKTDMLNMQGRGEPPFTAREREALQADAARLEEEMKTYAARQGACERARAALQRAMLAAGLDDFDAEVTEAVENLSEFQPQAMEMANAACRALSDAENAASAADLAEAAVMETQKRIAAIDSAPRTGPAKEELENRGRALRSLRGVFASMQAEEDRKKEIDTQIAVMREPVRSRNWTLIIFGCAFLLASVLIFCAHWFMGIDKLSFGGGMGMPINVWAAYVALFCGMALAAGGFSMHGQERESHRMELARLLSRSETTAMRMAELAPAMRQLAEKAGLKVVDQQTMDNMEMLIEQEKEQLFVQSRRQMEMAELAEALEQAKADARHAAETAYAGAAAAQRADKHWREFLKSCGIACAPAPQNAAAFFARLEAARLAAENYRTDEKARTDLLASIHNLGNSIRAVSGIAAFLDAEADGDDLQKSGQAVIAARKALAACDEADAARSGYLRMQEDAERARQALKEAAAAKSIEYARVEGAAGRMGAARHEWQAYLDGLGLGHDLAPDTVRAALQGMEECLANEETAIRAERDMEAARNAIAAFENELRALLRKLGRAAEAEDKEHDWLALYDNLLRAAREEQRRKDNLDNVLTLVAGQQDIVAAKEAALAAAESTEQELLAQGGAKNRDEFLSFARLRDERRNLSARHEDAATVLVQAAADDADFMNALENGSQAEDEQKQVELKRRIEDLAQKERALAQETGQLEERAGTLAMADELAGLRQREAMLLQSIRDSADEWSALAMARAMLIEARKIYEKERQPEIIRIASSYFAEITGGRWRGLCLDMENSALLALPPQGEPVEAHNLSRGAQEQAYLSLRLAHIERHGRENEPLPVIMDEILVNFDPRRARNTVRAFANLLKTGGQQLLYFTCQPHIVKMLREEMPNSRLYLVRDGNIAAEAREAAA